MESPIASMTSKSKKQAIRQEKEIKSTQVGKEENYLIYRGNDHIGRKPKIFHQKAVRTNK